MLCNAAKKKKRMVSQYSKGPCLSLWLFKSPFADLLISITYVTGAVSGTRVMSLGWRYCESPLHPCMNGIHTRGSAVLHPGKSGTLARSSSVLAATWSKAGWILTLDCCQVYFKITFSRKVLHRGPKGHRARISSTLQEVLHNVVDFSWKLAFVVTWQILS